MLSINSFPRLTAFGMATVLMAGCADTRDEAGKPKELVKLITLDPGHFHAALVQKSMYEGVDSTVFVYAPAGNDLQLHLDRVNSYNKRPENPTSWNEDLYTGPDYFEKMLSGKKGNVVVLAGNNQKKTEYILKSLEAGINVLADKPMVIDAGKFEMLKQAFATAREKNVILYDIMTERFEITSLLQRELAMMPEIFGTLGQGTAADPAVVMESAHNFYKYVSGNVVVRPAWFFDAAQQGQAIVDVATHLVDLVQWECFPGVALDYEKDVDVLSGRGWPTEISRRQFGIITRQDEIPAFLQPHVIKDSILQVWSNGEILYRLRGVHARVSVRWDFQTESGVDTHFGLLKGSLANLVVRQQQVRPALYIEPVNNDAGYENTLHQQFKTLQAKYPGIQLKKIASGWEVIIPETYKEGHEAHFARVTENFLEYLNKKNMPAWEVPNMLAKYYTTTKALELSQKNKL